jgi:hypothetical protein
MSDYDLTLLIDQEIREQISHELSLLSEEEKDLYDAKYRYRELHALAEGEHIENELDDVCGNDLNIDNPNKW